MLPTVTCLAVLALAAPAAAAGPARAPRPDPEAVREARRAGPRAASARAVASYLEGRRHLRAGEYARAAEALRLAVAYDEGSAELRVALAEALALTGRLDQASAEARRAVELEPRGAAAVEAHVLLGKIAAEARRGDEATLAFRQAIRIASALPADGPAPGPEPWERLAELYREAGDEEAAARVLEDLAEHVPGRGEGFRDLGEAALRRGDAPRAERFLRRAAELDARDAEARRLLARAHEALGRDADARADLAAVLAVDPGDAEARFGLGRLAVRAGAVDEARDWFRGHLRAARDVPTAAFEVAAEWLAARRPEDALAAAREGLAEAPGDARLRYAEGLALRDLRRLDEAAAALGAVRSDAGDLWVGARVALAGVLLRAGRIAEAERALEKPLAARPGEARLLVARAEVLERAGRGAEGVDLLRRAVADRARADDPDLPDLHAALAAALARAGRAGEAVDLLRAAAAARPRDAELLYALGVAYERAGRTGEAVAQMQALLALRPDHAHAMNFVGYTWALRGERLDEAERLLERARTHLPRSPAVMDSLGLLQLRRGRPARAVELLEQADRLGGPDPTVLDHLGDAYRAAGRDGDAGEAWRKALRALGEAEPDEAARLRPVLEEKLRRLQAGEGRPVAR